MNVRDANTSVPALRALEITTEGAETMDEKILEEIEETELLAHLSATHSNALVENPFD